MRDPNNPEGRYILRGTVVVPCPDVSEHLRFMNDDFSKRIVCKTTLHNSQSRFEVSTVFLGHDFWAGSAYPDNKPTLFETMTFMDGAPIAPCRRYSTWVEAEQGHQAVVDKVSEETGAERVEEPLLVEED